MKAIVDVPIALPEASEARSVLTERLVAPVPPLPTGSVPVMAAAVDKLNAPHAYVEAPVTRSTCPAVEESEIAVIALVPFPWRTPVNVAAPVPPLFTASVPPMSVNWRQTLPFAKHPAAIVMPLANVDVAVVEETLSVDAKNPPWKVLVAFVEVAKKY